MTPERKFKVTYSTLSSPDPLLHQLYDEAVAEFRANAGQTYPMYINGEERFAAQTFAKTSPVDRTPTTPLPRPKPPSPAGATRPGRSALPSCAGRPTFSAIASSRWARS